MNAYLENIENLVRCLLLHPTRVGRSLCLVKDETFRKVLEENLDLSNRLNLPVCQDTGVVTLVVGHDSLTRDELLEIKTAFENCFNDLARPSMLSSPFFGQHPLGRHQVCFLEEVRDKRGLGAVISGAGTETHCFLKVYPGTASWETVVDDLQGWSSKRASLACPPVHFGVAVGGTAAEAVKQSKLSFLFGNNFPTCYEHAYEELVNALRASTVDPLKNGESWAGDVFLRVLPTHMSAVPVSMSLMCWPYRAEWIDLGA